jgi:hypothetical protein
MVVHVVGRMRCRQRGHRVLVFDDDDADEAMARHRGGIEFVAALVTDESEKEGLDYMVDSCGHRDRRFPEKTLASNGGWKCIESRANGDHDFDGRCRYASVLGGGESFWEWGRLRHRPSTIGARAVPRSRDLGQRCSNSPRFAASVPRSRRLLSFGRPGPRKSFLSILGFWVNYKEAMMVMLFESRNDPPAAGGRVVYLPAGIDRE